MSGQQSNYKSAHAAVASDAADAPECYMQHIANVYMSMCISVASVVTGCSSHNSLVLPLYHYPVNHSRVLTIS